MLNTRINTIPVKKVGSENPIKARLLATWSKTEYGRDAGIDPDRHRNQ